jgi:hypothetical protein
MSVLTREQRELWAEVKPTVEPQATEGQTLDQARRAAAFAFQALCALEGVGIPSERAVLAELA